jgi:glycine/D-amino acid oxidase-like deaminating enzyme/nitrite reductase/ring-hydroxylating ferredoxin subunit
MAEMVSETTPYWRSAPDPSRFPCVNREREVDVVVVGAGVTGATTAYLLTRAGFRVAVLDRQRAASADTAHTSAHLTYVTDKRLTALVDDLGDDRARAFWDAGRVALRTIGEIVQQENIDCGFTHVPGYLHEPVFGTEDGDGRGKLEAEAGLAVRLGFNARFVERVPFLNAPGIEFADQARLHPLQYVHALLELVADGGGLVCENSPVSAIMEGPDGSLHVVANGHGLTCRDVVIATHTPIAGASGRVSAMFLRTKLAHYTSYVLAARVPTGTVPDALFWDTADPYRYLRVRPEAAFDVVIYGGHDHKTGQADDTRRCFDDLEGELGRLAPRARISHRWSGQVILSPDGLPLIGFTAPHQFAATAFNGNGLPFATLSALIARDALTGRRNPWRDLFDISRGVRGGAWDYVKENADYPYYLVRDLIAAPEGKSLQDLRRGQGKILDLDGNRVAAYRNDEGQVTLRSSTCTCAQPGCVVRWNKAERTWDCPCHGSRFSVSGDVLSGPAESPLAAVQVETSKI